MHFFVLALEGAYASSVAITLDALSAAAQIAPHLRLAAPSWSVCAPTAKVTLSNGLQLAATPSRAWPKPARADIWIVPGLGLTDAADVSARLDRADARRAVAQLQTAAQAGAMLAASCSATLLLARAGLLVCKKATTTWWLAPELRRIEPSCAVDVNRMVLRDGRVVTAGAALAQSDLMLYLIKETMGIQLADRVARTLLLDQREAQAPFIVPAAYASGDALIAHLTRRIESALPQMPSVPELAAELGMSARTLARHVQAATGRSPLALAQTVRVHKAQALLATSRLSVEEIASRVGYSDGTALRKLIKSATQATPRQLRGTQNR
jgi:transcriptional regulator GlxA family with amidase domain